MKTAHLRYRNHRRQESASSSKTKQIFVHNWAFSVVMLSAVPLRAP